MSDYLPPLRDMDFLFNEVFAIPAWWARTPALAEQVDADTARAVLELAGKLIAEVVAPLNRSGDEQGCRWQAGRVISPDGFTQAWRTFANDGWVGVAGAPAYGGMGMPKVIAAQIEEMLNAANLSFGLYPMLTAGACMALLNHASEALKARYLPPMYEGRWSGSMCLTEPHAGTDLGLIRTRAEPDGEGCYRVTGTKIFITGGEQDLTENIIHLVLARLPDAPAGAKGISLFLVPKLRVEADGTLGAANAVSCGSIEHKMGIKASATCVMNFDGAEGYLVGEANKGLAAMFTMMNYERLGVGIQGLALGERSWQNAIEYARERPQGRAATGPQAAGQGADPIIVHADVRRMLLTMKALNEGGRAFSTFVAQLLDEAKYSECASTRSQAEARVALLTPVAKAFLTDMGLETTLHGQQVFGGHGYIREWGQEQLIRDCRITQIYEGTNGIQALDLMGRKMFADGGRSYALLATDMRAFVQGLAPSRGEFAVPLLAAIDHLDELTAWVLDRGQADARELGAAAVEYLHVFGYTLYAYLWARMADAALNGQTPLHQAKVATARFYFARLLPRIHSLGLCVKGGSDSLYLLGAEQL
ncbi:acyl-CoA dehydrogenase C-terminal domain-containing protein [Pseudomonas sichuanensis]|uniref:acyl-CoA dehydrogenase C-terminal domain-containing protein n=1 Tax=Pseudomonas sichuanensis TaxID=2213015 RepID=UPI000DA68693|nr:acyl-CoA dehydrogenase C-terminal domain-containing protein [Pseudomonas sichuanensis]